MLCIEDAVLCIKSLEAILMGKQAKGILPSQPLNIKDVSYALTSPVSKNERPYFILCNECGQQRLSMDQ